MNSFLNHIRDWFGCSRRERRATSSLLLLVTVVFFMRFIIPGKPAEVRIAEVELAGYNPFSNGTVLARADTNIYGKNAKSAKSFQTVFPINLNGCDSTELESLPGIGPVLSARIIKYRNILGGFCDKKQLSEVYGLSIETFNLIVDKVYADSADVQKIEINKALFSDFIRHPYFDKAEINLILKYRQMMGSITDVKQLTDNKLLTEERARKLLPYLSFK
jgi:DNA uptake protein ComE-like DNA-binding protein